jgi:CRISPR-associated protein Cmr4
MPMEKNIEIFGSDKDHPSDMSQGGFRFFEANLLSLPVRSKSGEPFYRATSKDITTQLNGIIQGFGETNIFPDIALSASKSQTEFGEFPLIQNPALFGEFAILMDKENMDTAAEELPLLARNSLDNGQSSNLWYEEVVPRQTRFVFFVAVPNDLSSSFDNHFDKYVHNNVIQIGANATVGYGYCKFNKIN